MKLTVDELRAKAAEAVAALTAAEANEAIPVLSPEEAASALAAAEARLAVVEGPFWELEHARVNLNAVNGAVESAPDYLKDAARAEVPRAEARLKAATEAHAASGFTNKDIDVAAQAVLDARAAVAKAEEA